MLKIYERRNATKEEKASKAVLEVENMKEHEPRYAGIEESKKRLGEGLFFPRCFVKENNNYIPVRFRDNSKYLVIKL